MSEMTEIPENGNKPMHKYVYFAILCLTGYIVAIINSYVLYMFDLYGVLVEGNNTFNLMLTLGWPLAVLWDLYMRFINFNGSAIYIWLMWIILYVVCINIRKRFNETKRKQVTAVFALFGLVLLLVFSFTDVHLLMGDIFAEVQLAAQQILEWLIVVTPVVVFFLVTVVGGEYFVLRKQVEEGTFLKDQFVPSYDYVD